MPAMVSKPTQCLFSLILIFFAGPTCSCGRYCKCKSIMHLFPIWPPVAVNIICFQVHAIDGLGRGYRRNTLLVMCRNNSSSCNPPIATKRFWVTFDDFGG